MRPKAKPSVPSSVLAPMRSSVVGAAMWTQQRGPVLTSSVAHSAAHSPFVAPNQPTMVSSNSRPGWPQAGGCRGWGATHLPTSLLHLVLATDAPLRPGVSRGTHPSENAQGRMVSVAGFSSVSNVGLARGKPSVCGPCQWGPPWGKVAHRSNWMAAFPDGCTETVGQTYSSTTVAATGLAPCAPAGFASAEHPCPPS